MRDFLKISKTRVGILVGKEGKNKRKLQGELNCKLYISKDGEVEISAKDSLNLFKIKSVVKAIGRGFDLENAICLMDDEYILDIINIPEMVGKKKKVLKRFKGRVIGREGYIKNHIEELSNTHIVVFGKTVSIIGKGNDVEKATECIQMILDGRKYTTAFRAVEGI